MYQKTYEFRVRFTYDHRRQTRALDQSELVDLLREDLKKMGIPHPPKTSIFQGPLIDGYPTIEFFWCTTPNNLICKNVPRLLSDAPDHVKRKLAIISYEIFEKYVDDPGEFDIVHPPKITRDFVPNARYLSKLNEAGSNTPQPPPVTVPSQPRRANNIADTKPSIPVAPAAANRTKSPHGTGSVPTGPAYLSRQQHNFQNLPPQDLKSGQQYQQSEPLLKRLVVPSQPAGGAGTSTPGTPGKAPSSTVHPPRPAPYSKNGRPERRASLLAQPQSSLSPTSTPLPAISDTAAAARANGVTTPTAPTVAAMAPAASTSTTPPSGTGASTTVVADKEWEEQQQQSPDEPTELREKLEKARQLREKLEKARKSAHGWRLVEKKCVTQLQRMGEDVVMEESVNEAEAARLRAQVEDLNRQLEEEKNARSNAERVLKDVERECKHPFIMPQLLQAFLQVAHTTNQLEDSTT